MEENSGGAVDFRAKDLELLRSGNFADVVVICKYRKWKCHQAILIPRSVWFEKALSGHFEEATTGKVNLDEENPTYVDLALKYIYGNGLDVESSVSPEHFVEQCASLWHIADFLLLEPLISAAEKAVHGYCDKRMKQLSTIGNHDDWRDAKDRNKLCPWALDMISGIRESYKWNNKRLRAVLLEFLWVGRSSTLGGRMSSVLLDHLKDTASFSEDFFGHYSCTQWTNGAVWAPAPREYFVVASGKSTCRLCRGKVAWASPGDIDGQIFDPFELSHVHRISTGWCKVCSKIDVIPWRTQ
ncbi:hypothetical protein DHEL01_v204472 [Diaporthe helianthi]|uniref:BTB domain-containing protein n=1 Tax=Diaporthe helianthi TaxID=158607 RepID=A0A2P5I3S7_DIAHE|nr:hypothetical protein DHEL01_v204472 [Diaporthe helianthi]